MDNSGPPTEREQRIAALQQRKVEERLKLADRRIAMYAKRGLVVQAPAPRQPSLFGEQE